MAIAIVGTTNFRVSAVAAIENFVAIIAS